MEVREGGLWSPGCHLPARDPWLQPPAAFRKKNLSACDVASVSARGAMTDATAVLQPLSESSNLINGFRRVCNITVAAPRCPRERGHSGEPEGAKTDVRTRGPDVIAGSC